MEKININNVLDVGTEMKNKQWGLDLDGVVYNFIGPFDNFLIKNGEKVNKSLWSRGLPRKTIDYYLQKFGEQRPFLWIPLHKNMLERIQEASQHVDWYIITHRNWYPEGMEDTRNRLKSDGINYKRLIFSNEKAEFAKFFKLDFFIEDYLKNANKIIKYCPVLLVDQPYNQGNLHHKINRIHI